MHPVKEHSWGQRVVRFYDPDRHIIEVGENMKVVCRRFLTDECAREICESMYAVIVLVKKENEMKAVERLNRDSCKVGDEKTNDGE